MATAQQAARITDPITHGLGLVGIVGGMLVGAVAGLILIAALPVTAPALLVGLTAAAAVGAVAGGGLAGHQLLAGIQRACALPSPTTGLIGAVGSPNVRIGGLPAARVISELTTACNGLYTLAHLPIPPLPQARIAEGSQTIRINGLLAARVSSKLVCGASIQRGALTVYFGGQTERVLAVVDVETAMLSLLGFLAKASLVAAFLLTIPLGLGAIATFAVFVGGFMAVNYGLGMLGDHLPPGWRDILQGGAGLAAIIGGTKIGVNKLSEDFVLTEEATPFPKYKTTALKGFEGENLPGNRWWPGEVKYLSAAERAEYRVTIVDGKLYDATGALLDTSDAMNWASDGGKAIYVMDADGNMYVSPHQTVGEFHHSSLLAGEPVAAAGEVEVQNGVLKALNDRSGHYQPAPEFMDQAISEFESKGVGMSNVNVDYWGH